MKEHFVRKYMRLAKQVGEDGNRCYSRKIGVVIVRFYGEGGKDGSKVLGTGYNSPPRNTPHCDDPGYLQEFVWPQLSKEERQKANAESQEQFCTQHGNSRTCPRKVVGAPSGQRLELCSCTHAETNAIVNASDELYGAVMFCWCPVPCVECTKLIINSGIKKVYCWTAPVDYSHGSRYLFEKAGVEIVEHDQEYYLLPDETC